MICMSILFPILPFFGLDQIVKRDYAEILHILSLITSPYII